MPRQRKGNLKFWKHFHEQESPPAWTQEAYRPPCSKYTLCWSGGGTPGGAPCQGGVPQVGPYLDLDGGVLWAGSHLDLDGGGTPGSPLT